MKKEVVNEVLRCGNIAELDQSEGAIMLIHYPETIKDNDSAIADIKSLVQESRDIIGRFITRIDELNATRGLKRLFNRGRIQIEISALEHNIGVHRKLVSDSEQKILDFEVDTKLKTKEIEAFIRKITKFGVTKEEVIEEYNRLKEMFEKIAKGELVAPVEEVMIANEQTEVVQEKPVSVAMQRWNARMKKTQEYQQKKGQSIQRGEGE